MLTRNTSSSADTLMAPTTIQADNVFNLRNDNSQVSVTTVMPKENPNNTGLRHEIGPSQGPPLTRNTMKWKAPAASNKAPQA